MVSIPLVNNRVQLENTSILVISNGEVMFISARTIFEVLCSASVYSLAKEELAS